MKGLGRREPTTWKHVEKYPLRSTTQVSKPSPVVTGTNWYSAFDNPVKDKDGKWWVGKDKNNLGYIRGGHAVCMPFKTSLDSVAWWIFYNQIAEGKCVGEAGSRMASHFNRKRYDPTWLWNEAKKIDEWHDTNPGDNNGTSVRAAMDVLRTQGHVRDGETTPDPNEGILTNRWATSIDDVLSVLQNDYYKKIGAIPFLNSWGKEYPHKVWMPCETWERLLMENGEFTMVTDK